MSELQIIGAIAFITVASYIIVHQIGRIIIHTFVKSTTCRRKGDI